MNMGTGPRLQMKIVLHAQGCLLGQLAGDALGNLVESRRPEEIRREYPNGVRIGSDLITSYITQHE